MHAESAMDLMSDVFRRLPSAFACIRMLTSVSRLASKGTISVRTVIPSPAIRQGHSLLIRDASRAQACRAVSALPSSPPGLLLHLVQLEFRAQSFLLQGTDVSSPPCRRIIVCIEKLVPAVRCCVHHFVPKNDLAYSTIDKSLLMALTRGMQPGNITNVQHKPTLHSQ